MSTSSHQYPVVHTVTVLPALQTKFFFIPITGLQEGTEFRDIWTHLKKLVKRLEHIAVYRDFYPGCTHGWILVHKYVNYAKVIEALRNPVYVEKTKQSGFITPSCHNVENPVSIQLPVEPSSHVAKIVADCAGCLPSCTCFPETTTFTETVPDFKYMHHPSCRETIVWNQHPQVATRLESNTRPEIIIAHGTYIPENQRPPSPAVAKASRKGRKPRRPLLKTPPTPPRTPPTQSWEGCEPLLMTPPDPLAFNYQLNYQLGYTPDWQPYCFDHNIYPYYPNLYPEYQYDPTYCYYINYPSHFPDYHGVAEQDYSLWTPTYYSNQHIRARGMRNKGWSAPAQRRAAGASYWRWMGVSD